MAFRKTLVGSSPSINASRVKSSYRLNRATLARFVFLRSKKTQQTAGLSTATQAHYVR